MRAIPLELTRDVVSVYDQTKTTVLGRAAKKTLTVAQGGKTVVGSPLNVWADTITDAALTPVRSTVTDNGHELIFQASTAAGLVTMALYNVDDTTGVKTYVGKLILQLSSTTHTFRGVRLLNDSGATGWRIVINTIGTVATSGGLFSAENIALADFVQGLPATIPVATASGQKAVYWHQETGGTNNLTVSQGMGHAADAGLATGALVVANGLVAAPNFYTFNTNNPIVTVGALGVTTDWYSHKTGTITGLTGVFLLLGNYAIAVPDASSGVPVALQGQTCLFIPASAAIGFVKISDLSSGATSAPSYTTRDITDTPQMNTAVTVATMNWDHVLQRTIMQNSSGQFVVKKFINSQYELIFGNAQTPQFRTNVTIDFVEVGGITVNSVWCQRGWIYTTHAGAGQLGAMAIDLRSFYNYDYSRIISKVFKVPFASFVSLNIQAPIRSLGKFRYRLSGFGSSTGGFVDIPTDRDMTTIPNTTGEIQLEFQARIDRAALSVPLQIIEAHLLIQPNVENALEWHGDFRYSVQTTPARTAWSQVSAYTGSKHWEVLIYRRDTGALVVQANTQDNASDFELSVNDGSTFAAVAGAIASSPLLNVLRYKWSSPPAFEVKCTLREKV